MAKKIFDGVATALITPFKGEKIDYNAFEKLIQRQIEAGIDALVFCGTTGEAPTLSEREKKNIFSFAKKTVGTGVPIICGTATNSHKATMRLSSYAAEAGADALLCVAPYYNKGTEEGREAAFREVCSLGVPVILYNIPSRAGVDIKSDTLCRLADEQNFAAVKECAGVGRISENIAVLGDRYAVYSGNDCEFLPSLSVGASGVVSVLSNLYPERVRDIYTHFTSGNNRAAQKVSCSLFSITSLLFAETNPAPVKYAMSQKGLCQNTLRLPMSEIRGELCKKIDNEMKKIEQNI